MMGCLKTAPLFSTCETAYLVQSAVKGSPVQERHWHTEVSPAKGRQAFDGRERMFEEELREMLKPKERRKRCDVIAVYYYPVGRCSEDRFSVLEAHCGRTRENGHEFGTREILNQHKKTFFYHEVGPALEQGLREAVTLLCFLACSLLQAPLREAS